MVMCWLAVVIAGYHWLSLVIGYHRWSYNRWLSSEVIVGYHRWLVIIGYRWLSVVIVGYDWLSLAIVGYQWFISGYQWL